MNYDSIRRTRKKRKLRESVSEIEDIVNILTNVIYKASLCASAFAL